MSIWGSSSGRNFLTEQFIRLVRVRSPAREEASVHAPRAPVPERRPLFTSVVGGHERKCALFLSDFARPDRLKGEREREKKNQPERRTGRKSGASADK
jgi:hypothetical protein